MDDILNILFDYQRFEKNGKLQVLIDEVTEEYSSDEEMKSRLMPAEKDTKKDSE